MTTGQRQPTREQDTRKAAMAHSHYVMDLYFPDDAHPERPHREVLRIVADSDEAAITEGKRVNGWRKPRSFQIRSITSSTRSGDKVVFLSPEQGAEES
jgi:hypothetical protein